MSSYLTVSGLDFVLGLVGNRVQPPEVYHVALSTSEPGITATGRELFEPDEESGYLRGELPNESGNWDVINGELVKVVPVTFPVATSDWGLVRYWVLTDDPIAGEAILVGEFIEPMFISEGDQPEIPALSMTMFFGRHE